MDPTFSSGRRPADTAGQLAQTFRVPMALGAVFLILLVAFGLTSGGPGSASAPGDTAAPESTPEVRRCAACGVGETCDARTGTCVLAEGTPPPCLDGSRFDEDEGFCIPDETPPPVTPPPAATLAPEAFRTPEPPRTPRVPFPGNEPTDEPAVSQPPAEPDPTPNNE